MRHGTVLILMRFVLSALDLVVEILDDEASRQLHRIAEDLLHREEARGGPTT